VCFLCVLLFLMRNLACGDVIRGEACCDIFELGHSGTGDVVFRLR
jgi:hypothetical protein